HHVVVVPAQERFAVRGRDDVVRRRHHLGERKAPGVVAERAQGLERRAGGGVRNGAHDRVALGEQSSRAVAWNRLDAHWPRERTSRSWRKARSSRRRSRCSASAAAARAAATHFSRWSWLIEPAVSGQWSGTT